MVDGEPFEDFSFPFQQFDGANVNLVNAFTVVHPLLTDQDAENYLARLAQVSARIDESIAEARRIGAKKLIPPRFILNLTIAQMQQFIGSPAAVNPLVTTVAEMRGCGACLAEPRRMHSTFDATRRLT